ncbi:MAG: hypothetical protein ACT4N2_04175 [Hyphomicrobium sp.]
MLELVISVCLTAEPARCKDVSLTYIAETSPMQCMMGAPPEIAKWSEGHPKWLIKRWTCQPAGRVAKL